MQEQEAHDRVVGDEGGEEARGEGKWGTKNHRNIRKA